MRTLNVKHYAKPVLRTYTKTTDPLPRRKVGLFYCTTSTVHFHFASDLWIIHLTS